MRVRALPGRPSARHRVLFFRELGALLESGTPLPEALEDVGHIIKRGEMALVLERLRADLREGTPLHAAMARHPGAFDDVELAMLEAAGRTGELAPVCAELAERITVVDEVRGKLVSGLAYPALVGLSACVLLPLPLIVQASPAQFAIAAGTNLAVYVAALFAVWRLPGWLRGTAVATALLAAAERLPWFGGMIRDRRFMLVYSTLSATLRSGVPLTIALPLAGKASGEAAVAAAAERAAEGLREGRGLAAAVAELPGVDDESVGLLRAGEKTGALDDAARRQAQHHASRYRRNVGILGQVLRFGLSLLVAGVVALSVAAQFSKMLSDPLSMMPASQRHELERELKRATPQLPAR